MVLRAGTIINIDGRDDDSLLIRPKLLPRHLDGLSVWGGDKDCVEVALVGSHFRGGTKHPVSANRGFHKNGIHFTTKSRRPLRDRQARGGGREGKV